MGESASGAILSMGFWQTSRKLCQSSSCPPPQPVFACISFLPRLSSPEEDLPWQGPEEKEREGCWIESCHPVGTPESFFSAWLPRREGIPWAGTPKVQILLPAQAALEGNLRGAGLGVACSLPSSLFLAPSLSVRGPELFPWK